MSAPRASAIVRGRFPRAALLLLLVLACAAPGSAGARETKSAPAPAQKNPLLSVPPLVFYTAQGEPGACGRNCSEWIAAEGRFAPGSSQGLRELLRRVGGRTLPIFFHSPGGLQSEALVIGRIMRSRGMTAGVAKTLPRDCSTDGTGAKTCSALKQSGRVLFSDFRSLDATCSSACVYALAGAKTRRVPPGARLGVHTSKVVKMYRDGRISAVGVTPEGKAVLNKQERDYLRAMGLADGLYQFATGVPHEKIGYLSRDQIARFGIDPEPFQESNWILAKPPSLLKLVVETRAANEIRLSAIRLACGKGDRLQVGYFRGLASDETFGPPFIKLIAPGYSVAFLHLGAVAQIDSLDAGGTFETRAISASFAMFEAAAAAGSLEIVESGYKPQPAARTVKLSTDGLSQALIELRKKCTEAAQTS